MDVFRTDRIRNVVLLGHLAAGHTGDLPFYMVVFGHDHTAVHMAQRIDGRCRHLPGRFSGCYQKRPAAPGLVRPQGALHRLVRKDSLQAGGNDPVRVLTHLPVSAQILPTMSPLW